MDRQPAMDRERRRRASSSLADLHMHSGSRSGNRYIAADRNRYAHISQESQDVQPFVAYELRFVLEFASRFRISQDKYTDLSAQSVSIIVVTPCPMLLACVTYGAESLQGEMPGVQG